MVNTRSHLAALGVIGMEPIEPVIIAALITAEPLLLIGPHGTGKSYLLNRISAALGLESRHYNASLLNFDDLVGFPLPNGKGQLEYVQTPASIWGAQTVFLDEISRCRPDMQNKLFPIIHEKRVQGIALDALVYRWAAMNPPRHEDEEEYQVAYAGSEPLDAALADRFAFVVEVPGWEQFSEGDQERVIRNQESGIVAGIAQEFKAEIESGKRLIRALKEDHEAGLAGYLRMLFALLNRAGLQLSPRRAGMLLRNIIAVHAASVLGRSDAELQDSALLALGHSLPHLAQGINIDRVKLLAAHREAWKAAQLDAGDPCRAVLMERDPVRRVVKASRTSTIPPAEFSGIIADALAASPTGARHALALSMMESAAASSRLVAAVAEQCAELYAVAAMPQAVHESVHANSVRHRVWQHLVRVLAKLPPESAETVLKTNLLCGLFSSNHFAICEDVDNALAEWDRVRKSLLLSGVSEERTCA